MLNDMFEYDVTSFGENFLFHDEFLSTTTRTRWSQRNIQSVVGRLECDFGFYGSILMKITLFPGDFREYKKKWPVKEQF